MVDPAHQYLVIDANGVVVSPRWPPVSSLLKPEHATYEVASVNLSSISFITNKVAKVRCCTYLFFEG